MTKSPNPYDHNYSRIVWPDFLFHISSKSGGTYWSTIFRNVWGKSLLNPLASSAYTSNNDCHLVEYIIIVLWFKTIRNSSQLISKWLNNSTVYTSPVSTLHENTHTHTHTHMQIYNIYIEKIYILLMQDIKLYTVNLQINDLFQLQLKSRNKLDMLVHFLPKHLIHCFLQFINHLYKFRP